LIKLKLIVLFLFIGLANEIDAQNCIEPARISPFYRCNYPRFEPVCGCDGVTYRNQCEAYWGNGVNTWNFGVCEGMAADLYPNPILYNEAINITIQFPEFTTSDVSFYIVDMYAKVRLQRIFNYTNRIELSLESYSIPPGVYTLVITTTSGLYEYIKFIKA
jgi:hypothetical protein